MSNGQSLAAIMPINIVVITAVVVLLGDSCVPGWRRTRVLNGWLSLFGCVLAMLYAVERMVMPGAPSVAFNGAVAADSFAEACDLILLISAALAIFLSLTYLENAHLNLGEYYGLVLLVTAGGMLMASANDLIVLFVSLETLSVGLYVLAGFARTKERSEEAALKYFLLGAFAAGFLLYGIALIYGGSAVVGSGGTTNLTDLASRLSGITPSIMLMAGVALVIVGLGFKAAVVPFHMWTPDVYEGAPTSVTAFMAAAAKVAAFAAIIRVFSALIPVSSYWISAIQVLAVLTMFGGNILAVTQDNVKRMLAYSSIAHAGYLLVTVSAAVSPLAHNEALGAALFYLLAYALMTIGAFAVLVYLSRRGRDCETMADLRGLVRTEPAAAYAMLVFMLSLGGIPPTMGFIGKWLIFAAALDAGQISMAIALALASIISIYYYLRVVWMVAFQEPAAGEAPRPAIAPGGVVVCVMSSAALLLLLGVVPGLAHPLISAATSVAHP